MDRRRFFRNLAITAAYAEGFSGTIKAVPTEAGPSRQSPDLEGHTLVCEFKRNAISWKVYEDLRTRDGDEERLYFAKGVPRAWVASGKPIRISQAPTRWGRVSLDLAARPDLRSVVAKVELARPGSPKEIQVKLRVPKQSPIKSVTVNGRQSTFGGLHNDTVIIATGSERSFEVIGRYA